MNARTLVAEAARSLRGLAFPTRVVRTGEAAGLKLYARSADSAFALGTYELPVQKAVASNLCRGDVFYDIGANIGFFTMVAARLVGQFGHVYAFEPVPRNVAAIERSARLNRMRSVTVISAAVGARTGQADLLLTRHIGGATLASAGTPRDTTDRVAVDVVTLDEVIDRQSLRPPSLVKIDVEGAEVDVLEGMRSTLATYRPKVLYEIDDATSDRLRQRADAIDRLLAEVGYSAEPLPASYPNLAWHVEHRLASHEGERGATAER